MSACRSRSSASSYLIRRPCGIATTRPQPRRQVRWFDRLCRETPNNSARSAGYAGASRNASNTRHLVGSDSAPPNLARTSPCSAISIAADCTPIAVYNQGLIQLLLGERPRPGSLRPRHSPEPALVRRGPGRPVPESTPSSRGCSPWIIDGRGQLTFELAISADGIAISEEEIAQDSFVLVRPGLRRDDVQMHHQRAARRPAKEQPTCHAGIGQQVAQRVELWAGERAEPVGDRQPTPSGRSPVWPPARAPRCCRCARAAPRYPAGRFDRSSARTAAAIAGQPGSQSSTAI